MPFLQATPAPPTAEQVSQVLAGVSDPEIHRPITDLGMVKQVVVNPDGAVRVDVWLTVAGCPLRQTINRDVTAAVGALPGVSRVRSVLPRVKQLRARCARAIPPARSTGNPR